MGISRRRFIQSSAAATACWTPSSSSMIKMEAIGILVGLERRTRDDPDTGCSCLLRGRRDYGEIIGVTLLDSVDVRKDHAKELDQPGVEVGSALLVELRDRGFNRPSLFVGTIVGQGIEDVADSADAAGDRNGFTRQAARI